MTELERRSAALELLAATDIWPGTYAPPLYWYLWGVGVNVRPPHFEKIWRIALITGLPFGFFIGAVMWLGGSPLKVVSLEVVILCISFWGGFFGLSMAAYFALARRKYHLPKWEELEDR